MRANVYLTKIGASCRKNNAITRYGSDLNLEGFGSLLSAKYSLISRPESEFERAENIELPAWEGTLEERAAVALGFRKKNGKTMIARVEVLS